jgi:hypothetical protein
LSLSPTLVVPSRGITYSLGLQLAGAALLAGDSSFAEALLATSVIQADTVVEEQHADASEITRHPVEQGSQISDNAVDLFPEFTLVYTWSPSSPQNTSGSVSFLNQIYNQFLQLKSSKTLLNVYTGKRLYTDCLIQTITETTDRETENVLQLRISFVSILIVSTTTITIPVLQSQVSASQVEQSLGKAIRGTQQTVKKLLSDPGTFLKSVKVF